MTTDLMQSMLFAIIVALTLTLVMVFLLKRLAKPYQVNDRVMSLSPWKWLVAMTILAVLFRRQFSDDMSFLAVMVLISGQLMCARIDYEYQVIPNKLTLFIAMSGAILSFGGITILPSAAIIGALTATATLATPALLLRWLTAKETVGMGDIKLAAAMGLWLGWARVTEVILIASILGAMYGMIEVMRSKNYHGNVFPFGPFLAAASIFILLFRPIWA
jgi:leader peptidase (prepilin peptidase) / N-methyltransferase